jgi:hypothetical protein
MLKIVKANEPMKVEQLVLCIYSAPGLGKTSLAFTADAPLLLDCDKGAYRAKNRKDAVPVSSWSDIEGISADELKPYKTIILDTAGRALDRLTDDIIAKNPKHGRGGSLTLQGFGDLKGRFGSYLKLLRRLGKDVVLIAHMDEQRSGDEVIERLDVQGGSKGEIYKSADAMGRIYMKGAERLLDFNPRENSFGKNPCDLAVMPIKLDNTKCLAEIIALIKERLNQSVIAEKVADQELTDWSIAIHDCTSVEELNGLVPELLKAPQAVRFLAQKRSKDLGLVFDKVKRLYVATGAPPAVPTESRTYAEL